MAPMSAGRDCATIDPQSSGALPMVPEPQSSLASAAGEFSQRRLVRDQQSHGSRQRPAAGHLPGRAPQSASSRHWNGQRADVPSPGSTRSARDLGERPRGCDLRQPPSRTAARCRCKSGIRMSGSSTADCMSGRARLDGVTMTVASCPCLPMRAQFAAAASVLRLFDEDAAHQRMPHRRAGSICWYRPSADRRRVAHRRPMLLARVRAFSMPRRCTIHRRESPGSAPAAAGRSAASRPWRRPAT